MYDLEMQKLYLGVLLSNSDIFTRVRSVTKSEHFDPRIRKAVNEIIEYSDKYSGLPDPEYLKSKTGIEIKVPSKTDFAIEKWFMEEYPKFCLHKALENAVVKSSEYLGTEDYGAIENLIKEAMQTRLIEDHGLPYHENVKQRLQNILDRSGNITTCFDALDRVVGKLNYGDLVIYAGGSGTGKSLMLQNNCIDHWKLGKNVLYITLELHPELCARRMDAMYLEKTTSSLYDNLDSVDMAISKAGEKYGGQMNIKFMPSGTPTTEVKAYIKDYIQTKGIKPDVIAIDYLDLLSPAQKVSVGDTFGKDKAVSEELRNMMQEFNILCLTASQLNRTAVGNDDLDHSHIAGGISKINTADLVLGIIVTDAMREKGAYELQVLKTRNSSGTGRRVRLKFLSECMRIKDDPDFLANINTYMSNSNSSKTQMSGTEKQYNEIQNALNADDENYEAVDIETGAKLPNELAAGMGSNKLARLRGFISGEDDEDWDNT